MTWISIFRDFDIFGNGSDGTVTVTTGVDFTQDMHYDNLTVSTGGNINTRGYKIYVRNVLKIINSGIIQFDGKPASGTSGAAAYAAGSVGGTGAGGNGSIDTSNGSGGFSGVFSMGFLGGSAGKAGQGDAGAGEATGPAIPSAPDNEGGNRTNIQQHFFEWDSTYMNSSIIFSGFGANGSTGDGITASGGGGGGGGGPVWISARKITGDGTGLISSLGGNGGDADSFGGGAAGGSGGGGGTIYVVTEMPLDNTVSFSVNGGTAGNGGGGGGPGNDGDPGPMFISHTNDWVLS